jgi:hypothetical protein
MCRLVTAPGSARISAVKTLKLALSLDTVPVELIPQQQP